MVVRWWTGGMTTNGYWITVLHYHRITVATLFGYQYQTKYCVSTLVWTHNVGIMCGREVWTHCISVELKVNDLILYFIMTDVCADRILS